MIRNALIIHYFTFSVKHWVLQPLPSASVDQGGYYRTKFSFALRYNKGLNIPELWIIHKQKGFYLLPKWEFGYSGGHNNYHRDKHSMLQRTGEQATL